MRFVKLVNSARIVATFEDPKRTIHFGSEKGSTYIDHHDKIKRENYLKRHEVNENWNKVNAGSLSAFLLWGKSTNLESNLIRYVKQFDL